MAHEGHARGDGRRIRKEKKREILLVDHNRVEGEGMEVHQSIEILTIYVPGQKLTFWLSPRVLKYCVYWVVFVSELENLSLVVYPRIPQHFSDLPHIVQK